LSIGKRQAYSFGIQTGYIEGALNSIRSQQSHGITESRRGAENVSWVLR